MVTILAIPNDKKLLNNKRTHFFKEGNFIVIVYYFFNEKMLQQWAYNGRGWQRFYAQHVMRTKISLTRGKQLNERVTCEKNIKSSYKKVAIKEICDVCILL